MPDVVGRRLEIQKRFRTSIPVSQPTSSSSADASPHIKSRNPADRIGIYKQLEDVPPGRRLSQYESEYETRDVWDEFMAEVLLERYTAERSVRDAERAGRRWAEYMETRGRHHALATPTDVEAWCQHLVDTLKIKTAYNSYWVRIERFYRRNKASASGLDSEGETDTQTRFVRPIYRSITSVETVPAVPM